MPREITATVFNESAYAPYGGLIAKNLLTPRIIINNGGTSQKSVEVVPTENLYAAAPSGKPGKAIVNVSVCSPRPTTDDQNGTRRLRLDMLERHPYTTQVFVPMGARVRYLVVVADSAAGGDGPALETIKAFVAGDGQGVCYGAGVFHAAMSVVGEPVTFAQFQHTNGVPEEDCEFWPLSAEDIVDVVFRDKPNV